MLARGPSPLPGEHGAVAMAPPTAGGVHSLQQGWMGLERLALGAQAPKPQAHHRRRPIQTGSCAMAWFFWQQLLKAEQLLLQRQGTMGVPALKLFGPVAIQPGAPAAAQPAAKKGVGERSRQGTVA